VGAQAAGPIHIRGLDGKDLPGSPLSPFADEANHVAAAIRLGQIYTAGSKGDAQASSRRDPATVSPALRAGAPVPAKPMGADRRRRAATIVIPVHDGGEACLASLTSVLASMQAGARVLVVDDASSDPALIAMLGKMVRRRKIALIRHERELGFAAAANAGIQAAEGRDVVLLNSFTLTPPNWLERLRAAAYAAPDIGTVTPLSSVTGMLGYADDASFYRCRDQAAINRLDRMAERANGAVVIDIPVGGSCCLYLRRDCLDAVGVFRADVFAQGPCGQNDLCLRARHLGWRNVALPGLFVGHRDGPPFGAPPFGDNTVHLRARNSRIIEQLHPGHDALIKDFLTRDPLAEPRRRIELLRWRSQGRKWQRAVVLITHDDGGGVEQRLRHAVGTHTSAQCRAIVLRPATTASGEPAIAVRDGVSGDFPDLVYAMPRELPALVRLLRAAASESIEAHHLADYPPAVYDLITRLGIAYDVHVHDYAWFCPRVSLVAATNRYCGEPDLQGCEACVADNGHFLREDIAVATLRNRSAAFLAAARRVVVPSEDAGARMRRQFTGLTTITVPHEDDASIQPLAGQPPTAAPPSAPPANAPPPNAQPAAAAGSDRQKVCVVGAIGVHKGYEVLLACARDAARRDLALEFIVVGHTIDDTRMLATGRVFVTGRFEPDEAVALIAQQGARLAFLPSVCPETWCLTLGDVWRAGLAAVAFNIGAPAERIKRTGGGFVLPLGLSPGAINNALMRPYRRYSFDKRHPNHTGAD
jgi:GT2 family glycosyltransferase